MRVLADPPPNRPPLQAVLIEQWGVFVQGSTLRVLESVVRDGPFPIVQVEGRDAVTGLPTTVDIPMTALRPHI